MVQLYQSLDDPDAIFVRTEVSTNSNFGQSFTNILTCNGLLAICLRIVYQLLEITFQAIKCH